MESRWRGKKEEAICAKYLYLDSCDLREDGWAVISFSMSLYLFTFLFVRRVAFVTLFYSTNKARA